MQYFSPQAKYLTAPGLHKKISTKGTILCYRNSREQIKIVINPGRLRKNRPVLLSIALHLGVADTLVG